MIKKVIAVIILITVLSAFLVIFGGIAIIDISIKLMWLSFSAIIAFACKSLGWNISQEIVNKLLARQNFLPGTLIIDDNPSIQTDKIILYNLCWKDEKGEERLNVHEVEVRTNIYQVVLCLIRKEPLDKFLAIVQEIILKQPLFNMEYTLENKQLLTEYVEKVALAQEDIPIAEAIALESKLPNLKLYLERGVIDLKINGQHLRLENINGIWRNDPVIDYYLTCQLEDENISIQNQNTANRYLLRASKISLKRLWNLLSPIFKIERINLLDGEVTDFKMLVERKDNAWSILSLNWNFNDIMLASHGIIIEEIDGRFGSTDLETFNIKKLELKLYNHTLRVDGTITTPQEDGSYNYRLKLRSDKIFLKNNVDINIFDGFHLYGKAQRIDGATIIDVNMDGTLRLDIPGHASIVAENFLGKIALDEGLVDFEKASCTINGSRIALDDCHLNLNTGDYTLHLNGNRLDIALLTDQPIKGETFFYTTIKGNASKKDAEVNGIYRIENIKYRNLPLSSIHGRIVTDDKGVRLEESYWHIFNRNIPIHCSFEKN
ncbi:MAG: hypothetical protein Q4C03_04385, partial [bacterium]|nr:hypothetical protein [bacterium]